MDNLNTRIDDISIIYNTNMLITYTTYIYVCNAINFVILFIVCYVHGGYD